MASSSTAATAMRWTAHDDGLGNDSEELDDDVADLPNNLAHSSSTKQSERVIRRRSSKACDQCRKSKCKCERTTADQPCRSCAVLGTECTFLGPSRKRGPPKGYIDAIEGRLHQLEALLGIIISSPDPRAQSLVEDLSQDMLARDIIARVDNSPFGARGRKQAAVSTREAYLNDSDGAARAKRNVASRYALDVPSDGGLPTFVTPSNEWQDHLGSRLVANGHVRQHASSSAPSKDTHPSLPPLQVDLGSFTAAYTAEDVKISPNRAATGPAGVSNPLRGVQDDSATHSPRRTRRRTEQWGPASATSSAHPVRDWSVSPPSAITDGASSCDSDDPDSELVGAVGQLSLDDHEQVRFHGKASGLHLLGKGARRDKRIENGLWRFPPARVWPPVLNHRTLSEEEIAARAKLPPMHTQEHLLELYFAYVHPVMPVICKAQFMETFRARSESPFDDAHSPESIGTSSSKRTSQKTPTLLLLAMFALSARYTSRDQPLPPEGNMWDAGDAYLEDAKAVLNQVYASSRPSTCQALLLMSYREIGIGAMAQAWLYVGMAIRMAQDLGLHRFVDRWQRGGTRLFTEHEIQLRRRVWHSCVIMDRYVSTYIGRPLAIDDRDFDTPLPLEHDQEEMELWDNHPSMFEQEICPPEVTHDYKPTASRPIGTFNAMASLAFLTGNIVQSLYSVRHGGSRSISIADDLEKKLDRWYIELPDFLRYNPVVRKVPVPPPHVLTLHMNRWTAVLLLHRPFIHMKLADGADDPASAKAWDLCVSAATHISSLIAVYRENFCLKRGATFLSYFIFSAGIMHVTTLSRQPNNVQANLGLRQCLEALKKMDIVWPSAGRAWELLHGSNIDSRAAELAALANSDSRRKRTATTDLMDNDHRHNTSMSAPAPTSNLSGAAAHMPMPLRIPHPPSLPHLDQAAQVHTPTFSTITPTTTSSSDSFFGPYMRWSQTEMYHQGNAPPPPQSQYAQSQHSHSMSLHHANSHGHAQPQQPQHPSTILGGYAAQPPPPPPPQTQREQYPYYGDYPSHQHENSAQYTEPPAQLGSTGPMYGHAHSHAMLPPQPQRHQTLPASFNFPPYGSAAPPPLISTAFRQNGMDAHSHGPSGHD